MLVRRKRFWPDAGQMGLDTPAATAYIGDLSKSTLVKHRLQGMCNGKSLPKP